MAILIQVKQSFLLGLSHSVLALLTSIFLIFISTIPLYVIRVLTINHIIFILCIVFIFVFPVLLNSSYYVDRLPAGVFLSVLIISYCAFLLNIKEKYNPVILLIPFALYSAFIIVKGMEVVNPNLIFLNSKNWISYYLVLLIFPYYFRCFKVGLKFSYVPVLVLMILSTYSLSRAGIISSVLIFVSCLMSSKINKATFYAVITGLIFLSYILFLTYSDYIFTNELSASNRFSFSGFFKDARSEIFIEYLDSLDMVRLLLGYEYRMMFFKSIYDYNPHNSYLSALIGGGFFYLFLMLSSIFISIYVFWKNKPILILLLSCLFRISTDAGSLMVYFDFFLLVGVFSCFPLKKV
jgi:hypothetical protein